MILNGTHARDGVDLDSLVARVADEFRDRLDRGEQPDPEEYAARHPQAAALIRGVLASLELLAPPSPLDDPDAAPAPRGVLGDFRIVREVGRGGMGVVYEAEQVSLGRRVALKVLPFAATVDPKQLQRFHNEARAAASLRHPNIGPVFGVGCERGVHFYAMQFIDGVTLARVIADVHRAAAPPAPSDATSDYVSGDAPSSLLVAGLSTEVGRSGREFYTRAAELMIQAADALEHAHSLGIVHRDVKPGNLMVDAAGKLWVADFGLAKLGADAGLTVSGDLVGTLRYMSPEQALAHHGLVDHRSDVYALGATLYELLTGRPVVAGDDKREILRRIAFEEPVAPRKLDRAIPTDLETVVLKAIEKNPAERYASAKDLADDLRRVVAGEPIRAKRPSLARRASKWARRHRAVVATAAAALVVLLVGMGVAVGKVSVARRNAEEREAETRAVLEFVERYIFAAARPEGVDGGLGHDVSLRRAMEAALPFVEENFKDRPLIEARLRLTLGLSFRDLGDDATALRQFEAAHALYLAHRGPDHPDTILSKNKRATVYAAFGQHGAALMLREETLAQRLRTLSPDDPDTQTSRNDLAISYDAVGRHDEALALRTDTLERARRLLTPGHPDLIRYMNNLAISYALFGRHEDALTLREEVLARQKAKANPETEGVLAAMNNLAESYHAGGRYVDAFILYEDTLAQATAKLGDSHRHTLLVVNDLAWMLAAADDPEICNAGRAVELAAKAARLSPTNAAFHGTLGTAQYRAGHWTDAAVALEKAIGLRGNDNPVNADEAFVLAMTRWQLGDKAAARHWFEKGTDWMSRSKTRDDEARRFRAEAAKLLGIMDDAKRPDHKTPKQSP